LFGRTPKLPPPRDFGWTLRSVENAETAIHTLVDGRIELTIRHEVLTGIDIDMLVWWFQNFDGKAIYQGNETPLYFLWHPADHISVTLGRNEAGHVAPGQTIDICEAFGRDPRFLIDQRVHIHRWDAGGVGFHVRMLGRQVMSLEHRFEATSEGVQYNSCMRLGMEGPAWTQTFNRWVLPRKFPPEKAQAWLRHNVEEVGCFVDFLPSIYADAINASPERSEG
jgi:hypothetical protein